MPAFVCRVTVVEKNREEDIGGRLNELVIEGDFRFDTGPSLLLLPETYRETFAGCRCCRDCRCDIVVVVADAVISVAVTVVGSGCLLLVFRLHFLLVVVVVLVGRHY